MIASQDLFAHHIIDEKRFESLGQDEIVESPADIWSARIPHVAPIGILHSFRVQVAERVEIAIAKNVSEALALLNCEAGAAKVRVRVANVDSVVRHVQITAPNDRFLLVQIG